MSNGTCPTYKCILVNNKLAYLQLGPLKVENLRYSPFRLIIHEIISTKEINYINKYTRHKLTYNNSLPLLGDFESGKRTGISKAATYYPGNEIPGDIFLKLSRRWEIATGMNITDRNSGFAYRASIYGLAGLIENHSDSWGIETGQKLHKEIGANHANGDLIASFLIWLNDVGAGGGTFFSSNNAEGLVNPTRGSAVFWSNLKLSGVRDDLQYHGGCPVSSGSKFVLGKWIYHYSQWKNMPCGKYNNSEAVINLSKVPL